MQSLARDRRTGQFRTIAPTVKPPKKTVEEIHREAGVIAGNIRALMGRYRDGQQDVAKTAGLTAPTFRARMENPWMFRMEELEALAARYDVTVRQLLSPMKFEEE